jgi:prevent-host-death family protein
MITFPASHFANHVGQSLEHVRAGGDILVITRFGKPVAAIISLGDLDKLITPDYVVNPALEAALKELEQDIAAIRALEH